jgi:hypothetical protein
LIKYVDKGGLLKKRIFAIVDDEKRYTQLLYEFLYAKFPVPMQLLIFSEISQFKKYAMGQEIEIALVAQHLYSNIFKKLLLKNCYILQEKEKVKNIPNIYKYQSSKGILNELIKNYAESKNAVQMSNKKEAQVIGIYSPVGRTGQTTFALLLGKLLAQKKRVLYINLEPFSGLASYLSMSNKNNLSDLLYYLNYEEEKFVYKLANMVEYFGNVEFIPPTESFLDLHTITTKEWEKLIQIIKTKTEYEYLILDLSECINGLFGLLRMCNRVYSLVKEDTMAQNKVNQYEKLLNMLDYEDVLSKEKRIVTPEFKAMNIIPEELAYSQVGVYVKKVIKEDFDEEL